MKGASSKMECEVKKEHRSMSRYCKKKEEMLEEMGIVLKEVDRLRLRQAQTKIQADNIAKSLRERV